MHKHNFLTHKSYPDCHSQSANKVKEWNSSSKRRQVVSAAAAAEEEEEEEEEEASIIITIKISPK